MDIHDNWRAGDPCPSCGCESFIFTETTSRTVWFDEEKMDGIGFGDYVNEDPEKLECKECWTIVAKGVSLETLRDEYSAGS
jgi:hypothetical protein